jgi:hypothetical protein
VGGPFVSNLLIGVYYVTKWKEAIPTESLHRVVKQENVNVLAEIPAFGSFQGAPDLQYFTNTSARTASMA